MITTKQALLEHLQQDTTVKDLHFWGHTPKSNEADKNCLSQWFPATFERDGITYPNAEHYMMAQKARLFGGNCSRGSAAFYVAGSTCGGGIGNRTVTFCLAKPC